MRLTDREASFWAMKPDRQGMGLNFRCPCRPDCRCVISVPFANPIDGGPAGSSGPLWQRQGDTLDSLTLTPSIDFRHVWNAENDPTPCHWHGWVRDGQLISA